MADVTCSVVSAGEPPLGLREPPTGVVPFAASFVLAAVCGVAGIALVVGRSSRDLAASLAVFLGSLFAGLACLLVGLGERSQPLTRVSVRAVEVFRHCDGGPRFADGWSHVVPSDAVVQQVRVSDLEPSDVVRACGRRVLVHGATVTLEVLGSSRTSVPLEIFAILPGGRFAGTTVVRTVDEPDAIDAMPPGWNQRPPNCGCLDAMECRGRRFVEDACVGCHGDGPEDGVAGPSLENWVGSVRSYDDGSRAVADRALFEESMLRPNARIAAGFPPIMPVENLGRHRMAAVYAYLEVRGRLGRAGLGPPGAER